MFIETKLRSILKTVSWRFLATCTTVLLVFIFFGKLALATVVGVLESVLKMTLYFLHERMWNKVKFGRKEIPAFVLWFTGLPFSGKTTVADRVYERLAKAGIKVERLDSHQVRNLFPEAGYTREERNRHIRRVGHLASVLERNGVSVIASFISPYNESRNFVRSLCKNFVEVYLKASVETCMKRDYKGLYEKAKRGEIANFTGVSDVYEEPQTPELVIDTEKHTIDESVDIILNYLKGKFLKELKF